LFTLCSHRLSLGQDLGLIEHWLRNIRDVARLHDDELSQIPDKEERHKRLVELNVQEQCINLFGNSIIQKAQSETGRPRIHGMVYDISTGLLKHLDIDFKKVLKKYRGIYTVADFKRYAPVDLHPEVASQNISAEETRYIFDELDETGKGWIGKCELRDAMLKLEMDVSDEQVSPPYTCHTRRGMRGFRTKAERCPAIRMPYTKGDARLRVESRTPPPLSHTRSHHISDLSWTRCSRWWAATPTPSSPRST